MNKKENEKNQKIKCDVANCDYNNCDDDCCTLEEIKVSCNCDDATEKKETICDSFKSKSDYEEESDEDEDTEEE